MVRRPDGDRRLRNCGDLAARAVAVAGGCLLADAAARRHERELAEVTPHRATGRPAHGGQRVDVVVPARDEAAGITRCVTALRGEPAAVSLVVVDDGSVDATGAIAAAAGATVVRIDAEPPPGWTGKTRAMVEGAGRGAAPWLAFVDADVTLAAGALTALVEHAEARGLDAVSPLLTQRCTGIADAAVIPLAYWQYAAGMPGRRGGGRRLARALLNGQCLLVRRATYASVGGHGHPAVRGTPVEDAALARALAAGGARVALVRGASLGEVRMYASAAVLRRGFLKNAGELLRADPARGLAVAATGALLAQVPSLLVAAARRRTRCSLAAAALAWGVPAAVLAPRYRAARVPAAVALAHPLAATALQVIAVESLARTWLHRPPRWKGRPAAAGVARPVVAGR